MNPDEPDKDEPYPRWMPLSPLFCGALSGVALRQIFSAEPGGVFSAMSGIFIYCAPLLVSVVAVFLAERQRPRTWMAYAGLGAAANVMFVLGTVMILVEGLVCAVLATPLFALIGAVGGLITGAAMRLTGWSRHTMQAFALLPALLFLVDTGTPLPITIRKVEASTLISASPQTIWRELHEIRDIAPSEVDQAWAFRIGVPTPQSAITTQLDVPLRRVTMGRDVYFDQLVDEERENEFVRWRYRFYADSFPPHALDDHVRIGGHYFDLIDTSYALEPVGDQTRLTVQAHYRLSTRFNWYAGPALQWLLDNAAAAYLQLYRHRAEAER